MARDDGVQDLRLNWLWRTCCPVEAEAASTQTKNLVEEEQADQIHVASVHKWHAPGELPSHYNVLLAVSAIEPATRRCTTYHNRSDAPARSAFSSNQLLCRQSFPL